MNEEYGVELVRSEMNDIECGRKNVEENRYKKLMRLYERVRFEN
ncbi:antirepressor AbbA [Bacillus altitudinis]